MDIKSENNITTIIPPAYMDVDFVDAFRNNITKIIQEGTDHIMIDFTDVISINSSCLGVIIEAMSRLKNSSKEIVICNMQDIVLKIISVLNLQKVFTIYDSKESAVEFLKNK